MPTLSLKEFERLQKMMGLTMSDQDGEALNALRLANRVLTTNKLTWDDIFKKLVTVDVEEVEAAPKERVQPTAAEQSDAIDRAFKVVMANTDMTSEFGAFIESLFKQWGEKQWLSPKQREALFNSAQRAKKKR